MVGKDHHNFLFLRNIPGSPAGSRLCDLPVFSFVILGLNSTLKASNYWKFIIFHGKSWFIPWLISQQDTESFGLRDKELSWDDSFPQPIPSWEMRTLRVSGNAGIIPNPGSAAGLWSQPFFLVNKNFRNHGQNLQLKKVYLIGIWWGTKHTMDECRNTSELLFSSVPRLP